ncbi:hypothetical protein E3P92_00221 [Wallemia ichthyophaga]|nr:hypothetical protein E3P95_01567 [Wallemia ichthyophaga]TIB01029.1 hypothetical protein E3P94_01953 [Wallemia ichthyophaga]TIB19014.1 hypothetical protein E3P92_00221 [Wallemia ichthyophaga]TIB65145.1 hypothetical protein E3P78_00749 [Wallemia ichthyophaga]TIB69560.1 hypothetical protein E3P77_00394 [Wallemia ichthyophaga]
MLRDGGTGDWIGTFLGHKGAVWSAKLSLDTALAVTASADFSAKVWDSYTGTCLHTLPHNHIVRSAAISPDGLRVLTGGNERLLRLFHLGDIDNVTTLESSTGDVHAHSTTIKSVLWQDTAHAISGSEDGEIKWWTLSNSDKDYTECTKTIQLDHPLSFLEWSANGHIMIAIAANDVYFFDTHSPGSLLKCLTLPHKPSCASIHPITRDRFVVGLADDTWVRIYDYNTAQELDCFKGHHGPVHAVEFSPDGEYFASGSEDGTIRMWQNTPGPPPLSLLKQQPLSTPATALRLYSTNSTEKEKKHKDDKDSKAITTDPLSTRVWSKVKHEAQHYWHGSKLLAKEIRISARLQIRLLRGKKLTRRERRQLKRTTSDLLRLIPFVPFVLIPFMELFLPVALKLFPNMLPSTFEDKFAADEKKRKLLRVRLEMAKFLQETIKESGIRASESVTGSDEFKEFFRKIRTTGEHPSHSDVVKVARLFNNDLTLDNLSRPQLVSMCRYMNINAFGTDNYLRGHIRRRLEHLKRDDVLIKSENVDSLSTSELQHACQSRGIRVATHSNARLRDDLSQWVELHTTQEISGVLLVLSKAFNFAHLEDSVIASLEATLCSLPDVLLNEAELEVSDEATYKQKLDVLQEQEELIEDEAEQEQKEVEARQAQKEAEKAKKGEELEKARNLLPDQETDKQHEDDIRMTPEQLGELGQALNILSAKSSVLKERVELETLVEQTRDAERQAEEAQAGLPQEEKKVDKTNENVKKQVKSMINKIDSQLSDYDEKVGTQLNLIQVNNLGQISIHDLKQALRVIKHSPDEEHIDTIVHKLDVDKDGLVMLDDVVELAQEEGLGTVLDDSSQKIVDQGSEIRGNDKNNESSKKIKKEEIVQH